MKFVKTNWNQNLSEIGQQLNVKFAFGVISEDKTTVTNGMSFVKCRDFFGDVLLALEENVTKGIYGFSFNPKKHKIDTEHTRILVQCPDITTYNNFLTNFKHHRTTFAELSGVSYGRIRKLNDLTIMVTANKFWMKSVPNISWFTYFLKCCCYPLDNTKTLFENLETQKYLTADWTGALLNQTTNECNYYNKSKHALVVMLENIKRLNKNLPYVSGWDTQKEINTVHNSSGFSAMCANYWGEFGSRLGKLVNPLKEAA